MYKIIKINLRNIFLKCHNRCLQYLVKPFVLHEYIRIRKRLKHIFTPHVTESVAMPIFLHTGATITDLLPYKDTKFLNETLF